MVCVDDWEDWKEGSHPLQLWFNVRDFLVSLLDTRDFVLMVAISGRNYKPIFKQLAVFVLIWFMMNCKHL